jgi:hypothetical protein
MVKFPVLRWLLRIVSVARSASRQRRIAAEQAHARDRRHAGCHAPGIAPGGALCAAFGRLWRNRELKSG